MSDAPTSGNLLLKDFIQSAARLEDAVASLYDGFGRHFKDQIEFSYFWRLAAEAERYHAATIRILEAILPPDTPVDRDHLPLEIAETRELLSQVEALLGQYEATPPTAQEALRTAQKVENEGAEVHGRTQFAFVHPDLANLFRQLSEEDKVHRASFEAACLRFKDL